MTFLKMTSLTATPLQLGKLGLISKKSARALSDNSAEANPTPAEAYHAPSNPGSGSGDETLLALAQEARQFIGKAQFYCLISGGLEAQT